MQARSRWALVLGAVVALAAAPELAFAQSKNPCNPCNPCGGKADEKADEKDDGKDDGLVAVNPCHAKAGTVFHVGDAKGRDSISFTSDAILESFVGTTTKISGYIVFDPSDPSKGGKGMFMVPVKTFQTGIPLRDRHLGSEAWLDAAKNPYIKYEISGAGDVKEDSSKGGAKTYDLILLGTFTLHGKSKTLDVPARISYMKEGPKTQAYAAGDLLAARANFSIDLADFGITGPPGMDLVGPKVAANVSVQVRFTATTTKPGAASRRGGKGKPENPCNPCGGKGDDERR